METLRYVYLDYADSGSDSPDFSIPGIYWLLENGSIRLMTPLEEKENNVQRPFWAT